MLITSVFYAEVTGITLGKFFQFWRCSHGNDHEKLIVSDAFENEERYSNFILSIEFAFSSMNSICNH